MRHLVKVLTVLLALGMATFSNAATFDFSGNIRYNTDVAMFGFTLESDATDVRVWTDSFDDGANFDPITALWRGDGTLIEENDDDGTINPATQTVWDSGFSLASLAAGNYIFSVAAYDNFALGTTLADGFELDGTIPVPIEDWWLNAPGYYHVVLDGVDSAEVVGSPVPEPSTLILLGAGLAGLGFARIRSKRQSR